MRTEAVVFDEHGHAIVAGIDLPELGPTDALVEVEYSSIGIGTERWYLQGLLVFEEGNIIRYEHQFALIVIMIAPVLVLFLLLQKQFIGGLTTGAIKG